ncbi:DoxX family membrane protein [Alicyclobacillus sp. SO9]|uniref:DoxX family membrane protein n=1 Tax=Alicyclobacillus sp. SO9 TaxID=2665646 RepID=UPI0018E8E2AF|nr:DoxX family membrane protein [Alicyclobacillus sp. SO9]QQE77733.1 DoxX family membrane protein [Alicyclobacillus sp. SO9]
MSYFGAVGEELKKSWWNAVVVIVFTISRIFFGWGFFHAGWEKMTKENWFGDGKFDAGGLIHKMVGNIQHSHGPDPLHLNNLLVWFANHIFIPMAGFTDFLVVLFEMLIGICVFFGIGIVWTMLVALFLNLQFAAAGSANNFGYLVTDIVWFKWPKYAGLIGFDGYVRYRKGKSLLGASSLNTPPSGKGTAM